MVVVASAIEKSFLERTNQAWKIKLARLTLVLGCLPGVLFKYVYSHKDFLGIYFVFFWICSSIFFFMAYIFFEFFFIKCPNCGERVMWTLAKNEGPVDYYMKSRNIEKCNACGY